LKCPPEPAVLPGRRDVCCRLAAHAGVALPAESLAGLRQKPGPAPGTPLPANFLKQADEQTVAALIAVYCAMHAHGLDLASQGDWGVIAAPQLLGRTHMASAMQRFAEEGAWGISPHLIAHRSLHAVSGTISQALGLHGPNFGVGGGLDGVAEAFLVAAALLADGRLPGLWLVLTHGAPDSRQALVPAGNVDWHAAAFALTPTVAAPAGPTLRIAAGLCAGDPVPVVDDASSLQLTVERLLAALAQRVKTCWRLGDVGWAKLDVPASPAEGSR
jgi:hypothetical protein